MARNFAEVARRGRITGDFAKLQQWQKMFEKSPEVLSVVSASAAEEIIGKIKDGFRETKDPYGARWTPKKVPDGRKTLSGKTGNLKGGWHYQRADKGGFVVSPGVGYAAFHQSGAKRMAARKMVPDGRGLPAAWSKALKKTAEEALRKHFEGRGSFSLGIKTGGGGGGGLIAGLKRRLSVKAIIRRAMKAVSGDE